MNPNVNVQDWIAKLTDAKLTDAQLAEMADDPARPACSCCPPRPEATASAKPMRRAGRYSINGRFTERVGVALCRVAQNSVVMGHHIDLYPGLDHPVAVCDQAIEVGDIVGFEPVSSPARPAHYAFDRVECREAIREMLGDDGYQAFLRGNITRYVWRMFKKGSPKTDAMKARQYLDWLIAMMPEDQ